MPLLVHDSRTGSAHTMATFALYYGFDQENYYQATDFIAGDSCMLAAVGAVGTSLF